MEVKNQSYERTFENDRKNYFSILNTSESKRRRKFYFNKLAIIMLVT